VTVRGNTDVSIDGREYYVDTQRENDFWHRTIPPLRQQSDTSGEPSENSLNPEGAWLRGQGTWHRGAGQADQDGTDSIPGRFFRSIGVDPWTKGELRLGHGLHRTVDHLGATGVSTRGLIYTDGYVWQMVNTASDDRLVRISIADWSTTTITTGASLGVGLSTLLATDGNVVWALFDDKLVRVQAGTATTVCTLTAQLRGIAYSNGRLLGHGDNEIYDLTALSYSTGTLPAATWTGPTGILINSIADGRGWTYVGDYRGAIYKMQVKSDGTGLDVPIVAGSLPLGENALSMFGYLGFLFVGGNYGFRLGTTDSNGDITFGSAVDLGRPALTWSAFGRFVWVSADQLLRDDPARTGTIRIDLSVINEASPAYASDFSLTTTTADGYSDGYMLTFPATSNGPTFRVAFAVEGRLYVSDGATRPDIAWLETGKITYGLTEQKRVVGVSASVASGELTAKVQAIGGSYVTATPTLTPSVARADVTAAGASLRLRLELDHTETTVVDQVSLRALPAVPAVDMISVPVLLYDNIRVAYGDTWSGMVPATELAALYALRDAGALVSYVELGRTQQVQVVGVDWWPDRPNDTRTTWGGTAVVTMKGI
jgi:hypothetical protein